jgi:hypothetical protein
VIGANTLTTIDSAFIENLTTLTTISLDNLSATNLLSSFNGSNPETIDEIRENANNIFNSQYRLVTKYDWKAYLESRSDIKAASV